MKANTVKIISLLVGFCHSMAGEGYDEAEDIMETALALFGVDLPGEYGENLVDAISKDGWNKGAAGANIAGQILVATECGKVIKSQWLPKEQRFEMLGASGIKDHEYWMPYPKHPKKGE